MTQEFLFLEDTEIHLYIEVKKFAAMDLHQCLSKFLVVASQIPPTLDHSISLFVRLRVPWRTLIYKHACNKMWDHHYILLPDRKSIILTNCSTLMHEPHKNLSKNGSLVIYQQDYWTHTKNHMNHEIHDFAIKTNRTYNITYHFQLIYTFHVGIFQPSHSPTPTDHPPCTSKASCHWPSAAQAFKATMPARSSSSTLPRNKLLFF